MCKICEISFLIIILIGVIGNLTNILVLSKKSMLKSLTFKLFLYLSTMDLFFFTQKGIELLVKYSFATEIRETSVVFCKLYTFLSYFLMQARNVFTMSITLSYLIEITKLIPEKTLPFNCLKLSKTTEHQPEISNQNKSFAIKPRTIFFVTLGVLSLINVHLILFFSVNVNVIGKFDQKQDKVLEDNFTYSNQTYSKHEFYVHFLDIAWIWIDAAIYFLIPFSVNLVSFLFILFCIKQLNKRYLTLLNIENYKPNARIYLKRMRQNRRILWRLLLINLYFFLSSAPSYVSIYILFSSNVRLLLNHLGFALFYSNNSMNFLFYGLSSQKYRAEIFNFFRDLVFYARRKSPRN
jgi:hypothetical protein